MFTKSKTKEELVEMLSAGKDTVMAAKESLDYTNVLISTAVTEASSAASSIINQLSSAQVADEGILFINYRGVIIHANKAAQQILDNFNLLGQSIEKTMNYAEDTVLNCSNSLFEMLQARQITMELLPGISLSFNQEAVKAKPALNAHSLVKVEDKEIDIAITLLETNPEAVEDIIYLCKLIKP
jgi:hypothetical protein